MLLSREVAGDLDADKSLKNSSYSISHAPSIPPEGFDNAVAIAAR